MKLTQGDLRIAQLEDRLKIQKQLREQDSKLNLIGSLPDPENSHGRLMAGHDRLIEVYRDLISRMQARLDQTTRH